jgi:AcrR family transcriptional regulator
LRTAVRKAVIVGTVDEGTNSRRERTGIRRTRKNTEDPRSAETRARLCEAFERVVARDGYVAATASRIAVEAGVSRSAFYDHFASPLSVALAVVESLFETIASANHRARATGRGDRREATRSAIERMTSHMFDNRSVYRHLLLSQASSGVLITLLDKFAAEGRAAVQAARPDLSARGVDQAARVIAGAVLSTMTWWLQQDDNRPPSVLAEELVDLLPEWFTRR